MEILSDQEDLSKFKIATKKELKAALMVREEPIVRTILIDPKKKQIAQVHIKEATVIETQRLMESFIDFGGRKTRRKKAGLSFRIREYYKEAWDKWMTHAEPPISYRDLKYFKHDFNKILGQLFPSPFDLFGEGTLGIDEDEEKNSEELSEDEES
jgi:hypothetical protein